MTNLTERPHFRLSNAELEVKFETVTNLVTRFAIELDALELIKFQLFEEIETRKGALDTALHAVADAGRVIQISPYLRRKG